MKQIRIRTFLGFLHDTVVQEGRRLGQAFCDVFDVQDDDELYYEKDGRRAIGMITDRHLARQ